MTSPNNGMIMLHSICKICIVHMIGFCMYRDMLYDRYVYILLRMIQYMDTHYDRYVHVNVIAG